MDYSPISIFIFFYFFEFLDLCCSFSMGWGSLVYFLCTWVVPFCAMNKYTLFIRKEKGRLF
jgi:hypothetical protein